MNKVTEIVAYGKLKNQSLYMIMPRYGTNLEEYFSKNKQKMSKFSVLAIGIALLNDFQKIHEAGFTFNDLKPDNILMGFKNELD